MFYEIKTLGKRRYSCLEALLSICLSGERTAENIYLPSLLIIASFFVSKQLRKREAFPPALKKSG
jgi:hypothetical protein